VKKKSKTFKPSTYQRKIRDLNKIILIQEQTIMAKDVRITASKKSQMIIDAGYDTYKDYAEELKKEKLHWDNDRMEMVQLISKLRTKYNNVVVKYNLGLEKIEGLTTELYDSHEENEELSNFNMKLQEKVEQLDEENKVYNKEQQQKEELDGYDEEEDKPN
jgi:hypothetical protein